MEFNKLKCALYNSFCKETAYKNKWSSTNKTLGQCAVTALIVNDYFGGSVKKCVVEGVSHYFNEIDNIIYDLTSEQFELELDYTYSCIKTREEILNNLDTKKRYKILSLKVNEYISNLDKIDDNIHNCSKCLSMVEKFTNPTSISYGKRNDIVILGEAPANNGWRKSGKAWYDINNKMLQSGKILNSLLNIIGFELEDTVFLEAIKCFPKNRKDLKKCNANCKEYLQDQLKILNPKIVITLGDSSTRSVLDVKYKNFSEIVGNIHEIEIDNRRIKVLPIYHPSPISPIGYKGNIPIFDKIKIEF